MTAKRLSVAGTIVSVQRDSFPPDLSELGGHGDE